MTHTEPTYGPPPRDYLQSVDIALNLILMLRDSGTLTISEAAETLGVAPSTVHRSLSMLTYRGFAIRSESRAYLPGPAIAASSLRPGLGDNLVAIAEPYMHALATETGETCNIMALSKTKCHFLHSVEGTQLIKVGSRMGQVIPATENSGGLAMLAEMSASEIRALYPEMPDRTFEELRRTLRRTRARGFAINNGIHEADVSAVGTCLLNDLGDVLGALSISVPSTRFRTFYHRSAEALMKHSRALNRALQSFRPADFPSHRG